jgi:hypothetical protein
MPQTGKLASWPQAELEGSINTAPPTLPKKTELVQPTHRSLFLYKVRNTDFYDTGLQVTSNFQDGESVLVSRLLAFAHSRLNWKQSLSLQSKRPSYQCGNNFLKQCQN